ncbi:MAG: hypothetical protein M1821_005859 [Bathelium mastoideum]|nr:MAG: hypothetical protein M1821_005859 [Bathelium mastoideum]
MQAPSAFITPLAQKVEVEDVAVLLDVVLDEKVVVVICVDELLLLVLVVVVVVVVVVGVNVVLPNDELLLVTVLGVVDVVVVVVVVVADTEGVLLVTDVGVVETLAGDDTVVLLDVEAALDGDPALWPITPNAVPIEGTVGPAEAPAPAVALAVAFTDTAALTLMEELTWAPTLPLAPTPTVAQMLRPRDRSAPLEADADAAGIQADVVDAGVAGTDVPVTPLDTSVLDGEVVTTGEDVPEVTTVALLEPGDVTGEDDDDLGTLLEVDDVSVLDVVDALDEIDELDELVVLVKVPETTVFDDKLVVTDDDVVEPVAVPVFELEKVEVEDRIELDELVEVNTVGVPVTPLDIGVVDEETVPTGDEVLEPVDVVDAGVEDTAVDDDGELGVELKLEVETLELGVDGLDVMVVGVEVGVILDVDVVTNDVEVPGGPGWPEVGELPEVADEEEVEVEMPEEGEVPLTALVVVEVDTMGLEEPVVPTEVEVDWAEVSVVGELGVVLGV